MEQNSFCLGFVDVIICFNRDVHHCTLVNRHNDISLEKNSENARSYRALDRIINLWFKMPCTDHVFMPAYAQRTGAAASRVVQYVWKANRVECIVFVDERFRRASQPPTSVEHSKERVQDNCLLLRSVIDDVVKKMRHLRFG